jgi:hypothetical protein
VSKSRNNNQTKQPHGRWGLKQANVMQVNHHVGVVYVSHPWPFGHFSTGHALPQKAMQKPCTNPPHTKPMCYVNCARNTKPHTPHCKRRSLEWALHCHVLQEPARYCNVMHTNATTWNIVTWISCMVGRMTTRCFRMCQHLEHKWWYVWCIPGSWT